MLDSETTNSSWIIDDDQLTLFCYGIFNKVKLSLLSFNYVNRPAEEEMRCEKLLQSIVVSGLPCTQMPSASNMIQLMNIGRVFEKYNYLDESLDCQFLTGLTMVSGRKFTQALEIFQIIQKKITAQLLQLEETKDNVPLRQKILEKNSKIEILIADCCSQQFNISGKLQAF